MATRNAEVDQNRDPEGKQIFPQGVVGGQPAEEGARVPEAESENSTPPVKRDVPANKGYDEWDDDGNEGHPTYDTGAAPSEQPYSRGDVTTQHSEDVDPEKRQLDVWIQTSTGRQHMDE